MKLNHNMKKHEYVEGYCPHCGKKVNAKLVSPREINKIYFPPCIDCLIQGKQDIILEKKLSEED